MLKCTTEIWKLAHLLYVFEGDTLLIYYTCFLLSIFEQAQIDGTLGLPKFFTARDNTS